MKNENEPGIFAQAAVILDGDTGRVLFGKNEDRVLPMASTTKIMTCILALEYASPDDTVTVSAYAASMPDVQLHIQEGETYRLEDLLYSLMLESHNDAAAAIAEHIGGSVEAFAAMMNQKARDIGCASTWFVTPNGLDGVDDTSGRIHSTTAKELAQIMRYCIRQSPGKEEFLEITGALSHTFSDLEQTRTFSCRNRNALLTSMDGMLSGKTGFTNGAGYCYIGAVEMEGKMFIISLLACGWPPHKTYKWQDMAVLTTYANERFTYREISPEHVPSERISVKDGAVPWVSTAVCSLPSEPLRILMSEEERVSVQKKLPSHVTAPIEAGVVIGKIDWKIGEDLIASYPVVTTERVERWDLYFCIKSLLKSFLFCYNPQ